MDDELKAMQVLSDVLEPLEAEARIRVLKWAMSKYVSTLSQIIEHHETKTNHGTGGGAASRSELGFITQTNEIPGIAKRTEEDDFVLTVRDIKAKSANDAAIRLAHVVILAYEQLFGENRISSKDILVPILKNWRVYNSHTRRALSDQNGIIRNNDWLSLDLPAQQEAGKIIDEILNPELKGSWSPPVTSKKRKKQAKATQK